MRFFSELITIRRAPIKVTSGEGLENVAHLGEKINVGLEIVIQCATGGSLRWRPDPWDCCLGHIIFITSSMIIIIGVNMLA